MVLKETVQPIEIAFTLGESAVNVYTSLEIDLPVNVNTGLVFDIDQIEVKMSPSFDPVAAGEVVQEFQFTFNDQTAILFWENDQVVAAGRRSAHASAALLHSGAITDKLHMDTKGRANLIARTSLFLGIDSVNTTVGWRIDGRLIGSLVKVTQTQLTQLVLNQLT